MKPEPLIAVLGTTSESLWVQFSDAFRGQKWPTSENLPEVFGASENLRLTRPFQKSDGPARPGFWPVQTRPGLQDATPNSKWLHLITLIFNRASRYSTVPKTGAQPTLTSQRKCGLVKAGAPYVALL